MKTRITEMLRIKYPIIQAGMCYVAGPQLAAAVSKAGGLGNIATYGMSPEDLRQGIRYVREQTDNPFAVNIVPATPREEELARVVIEERVPVISHGRGNPRWLMELTQTYKVIKMPTVGALKHAIRAEKDGVDIIVVQGSEGGGHTGRVSSLVLIPTIARQVKIPVVAAGGFCDGQGLAAALAMGADGIYMGTRFALTQESALAEAVKGRFVESTADDTTIVTRVTGHTMRVLSNRFIKRENRWDELLTLPFEMLADTIKTCRLLGVSLPGLFKMGARWREAYGTSFIDMLYAARNLPNVIRGLVDGDVEMGTIPMGQVVGRLEDIPTCEELIQQIVREAEATLEKMKMEFAA